MVLNLLDSFKIKQLRRNPLLSRALLTAFAGVQWV